MIFTKSVTSYLMLLVLPGGIAGAQDTKLQPKLAGDVFKNVQVLKGLPEEQFWATMSFFADSLGVNCEHCHQTPYEADIKPEKIKARQMLRMVLDMNSRYFDGTQKVTCNSCHRGSTAPIAQPSLDAQHWMAFNSVQGPLPDAAALIARYQKSTGIAPVSAPHAERVLYEMTIYLSEAQPRKELTELTTAGPDRFRMTTTSDGSNQAWIRDGAVGWTHDVNGWHATDGTKMFDASGEASSFNWLTLNRVSDPKTVKLDIVRGRPVAVVEGNDGDEKVWFYFDQQTGFLLRRRGFFPTYFADGCWDMEFDDYRRVGPVMLPFLVQILNPSGNGLTIRKAKERVLLPTVDAKLFAKPESAN